MRKITWAVLVALLILAPSTDYGTTTKKRTMTSSIDKYPERIAYQYAKKIKNYHKYQIKYLTGYTKDLDWLYIVAKKVRFFGHMLGMSEEDIQIFLANINEESTWDPTVESSKQCQGLTQIYPRYIDSYKVPWKGVWNVGDDLTKIDNQIALGWGCYYLKRQMVKGDKWLAIERYNGVGPDARNHRRKVFMAYKKIFDK